MTAEAAIYLAVGGVCNAVTLAVAIHIGRQARRDRQKASEYLDMAAAHGKVTDSRQGRAARDADQSSGRGCGTAGAVIVAGAVAVGWANGRAAAAEEIRTHNEATAMAEWQAAGSPGTRSPGS